MDYDRIIAISNDKTVYHHGNKRIKVYALKENFVYALEEALKTSKVINKTQLKVPTIYSVTQTKNFAECVGEFVEGETLFSILKQNSTKYKKSPCHIIGREISLPYKPNYLDSLIAA